MTQGDRWRRWLFRLFIFLTAFDRWKPLGWWWRAPSCEKPVGAPKNRGLGLGTQEIPAIFEVYVGLMIKGTISRVTRFSPRNVSPYTQVIIYKLASIFVPEISITKIVSKNIPKRSTEWRVRSLNQTDEELLLWIFGRQSRPFRLENWMKLPASPWLPNKKSLDQSKEGCIRFYSTICDICSKGKHLFDPCFGHPWCFMDCLHMSLF